VGAEIYYIKAIGAMRAPDCGRVMDNMEKVVSLSPNNSYYQENFLLIAANCFFAIGDEAAQVELYNTMLSQIVSVDNKESFNMKTNIARAYSVFGSYVNKTYYGLAEKMFNELIADYPNSTFAYEDLGRQKIWQEDYRAAIKIFEQGLTVLPPLNYPNFNQQHRQQVEAVAVRFYENIGQAYLKLRNYDQARFYFEKILKIAPYRTTAYKGLADAYYLQGRLEQAIVLNQRGFMLSPTDYHWPLALSLLYREKKDLASAKKYLAQALELAPENTELKQYQGELGR
jgi:tetratricopeptide (TPR) repeat protein